MPHAYRALQKVVQYQSGWSLSTCGVEELIAHQRMLFTKHRKKAQTQRWIDECELTCCHELGVTYDEIAQLAAKTFVSIYAWMELDETAWCSRDFGLV